MVDDKLKKTHCFVFARTEGSSSSYAATTSLSSDNSKPSFSSSELAEINSRNLASAEAYSEADICREYFLSYSVFCAFMLTLFLVALLIVSEIYMRRLLEKVLEMEIDLEWQDVEEFEEEEALGQLAAELQMQQIGMNENDIKKDITKESCSVAQNTIAMQETAHLLPTINPHLIPDKTVPIPKNQNPSPRALDPDSTSNNTDGDTVPLVFSLQNPASMVTTQTHTEPPVSTASLSSTITSDSVLSPPFPVSHTGNGHHSPYADSYSRTRSVTLAPAHEGGMHPYRLTKAISGLGPVTERRRAASYSRARSASFRHTDSSTPHSMRKSVSTTSGTFMDGEVRSDATTPRLPPESIIQEHAQQMKDLGRTRSNTFLQYMSDSLPVTLMSSR